MKKSVARMLSARARANGPPGIFCFRGRGGRAPPARCRDICTSAQIGWLIARPTPVSCWAADCGGAHIRVCVTLVCIAPVDRLSVTMPPAIGAAVREAAARQGASVSTWLVAAAAQRLRNELLGAALDRWEAEEGPFTDQELNDAVRALGSTRNRGTA